MTSYVNKAARLAKELAEKPMSAEEFADHLCLFNRGKTVALIKARDAALSATQGVEGWQLVPKECTGQMHIEGHDAQLIAEAEYPDHGTVIENIWRAMLDAAPKAPIAAPDAWQGPAPASDGYSNE